MTEPVPIDPLASADLEKLLEASRALSAALDLPTLLTKVMETAARVTGAETGSLLLIDEKTGELVFDTALGRAGEMVRSVRLKPGEGLAGWVAQQGLPLVVNNVQSDPRWTQRIDEWSLFATQQVAAVPVVYQGRLLGVLEAINKAGAGFTTTDRRALELLAAETAVALENARLFERLRAEKEMWGALFSDMSDGALLADEEGRITLLNAAGARLLGISAEEARGKTLPEATFGCEVRPRWKQAFAEGASVEVEIIRPAVKRLVLEGRLDPLRRGSARLFVFRDVTEARREDQIKRDFLSLISHKLKTPLVAITGYAPLLLQDKTLSDAQRKGLSAIRDQGQKLWHLVERLLNFSTVEAESLAVKRRRLKLADVLEKTVAEMAAELSRRGASVRLDPGLETLPAVSADPARVAEVARNLVENAAKFDLRPQKEIRVYGRVDGADVLLSVEDGGPGVPPEEIPRLFKKFYQIEESFTGQVEGVGLGLALVKRIMEAHGGDVRVTSVLGRGSIFTTRWPRAD